MCVVKQDLNDMYPNKTIRAKMHIINVWFNDFWILCINVCRNTKSYANYVFKPWLMQVIMQQTVI